VPLELLPRIVLRQAEGRPKCMGRVLTAKRASNNQRPVMGVAVAGGHVKGFWLVKSPLYDADEFSRRNLVERVVQWVLT